MVGWETQYPPKVNRLDVFVQPGANREQVAAELSRVIDHRADVRTPDMQRRSTQEVVSGLQPIDKLIASNLEQMTPGARVKITGEER